MDDRLTQTSKFLSYVLRHNPDALNLELEPGGWADVETLIGHARADGRTLSRSRLRHVLDAGEKRRFTLSEDATKIRANYGHSIDVNLDLTPMSPDGPLHHGTAEQALSSIRKEGLRPQSRQYVHLSPTWDEATSVGARHGIPVVLPIDAPALHEAGHTLYRSTDTVWLTRHVPPSFLTFPDVESEGQEDD
ncbi:MAG: RNA 2'-phosphotransferase [Bacteroidetes bacterium SW_9_63_38]|nr:MAG: RNA 2'-phosphotransferase [Bacteroidetes bacterium SW_9_63_38]